MGSGRCYSAACVCGWDYISGHIHANGAQHLIVVSAMSAAASGNGQSRERPMACTECNKLKDVTDLSRPYVARTCKKCGRKIKLRTPGAHGIGIKVSEGDEFIMPAGFLTMSANPLKGSGQFTSHGLRWFAEMIFGVDISKKENREDFRQRYAPSWIATRTFSRTRSTSTGSI
jgi:hypothetical protein